MAEKLTPRPAQEYAIERMLDEVGRSNGALIGDEPGFGKAQPLDSMVLTPDGYVRMGDVTVGMRVISPDGSAPIVSGVFPQGERPIYRITLRDGRSVEADEDHLWTVWSHNAKKRGTGPTHHTTRELLATLHNGKDRNANWYIQNVAPVDLGGEWASTLDPYLIGLLLGDGSICHSTPMISSADEEILDEVRRLLPAGLAVKHASAYDYCLSGRRGGRTQANALKAELERLGLWGTRSHDKFVPNALLNSSRADRLALLQGLLDTDGSARAGGFEFGSMSPQLAADVMWLVRSLGGRASAMVTAAGFTRVAGRLPLTVAPFRLTRKMAALKPASAQRMGFLAIQSIEYVGMKQAQCIMVDSDLHEYVTDNFIRTHNTLIGVEFALRAGFERVLFIALPDTHKQWAECVAAQSDGSRELRIMDGSKEGRANFEAFQKKESGWFIAGSHYLAEKDWESVIQRDEKEAPIFKRNKKTGALVLKERKKSAIGPALEPAYLTKSQRKNVFGWTYRKPLDAVLFDEVQAIANKRSNGFQTIYSIKTGFRAAISGTWFLNSLANMWTIAVWTWPGRNEETGEYYVETSHERWKERYLLREVVYGKDGRVQETARGTVVTKITGERNPGEFVASLPCYIRREKDDRAPEAIRVTVEPTPEQAAQMEDLQKDLMTWVTDWKGEQMPLVVDLPPILAMRLRQVTIAELSIRQTAGGEITEDNLTGEREQVYFAPTAASSKLRALRGVLESDGWRGRQVGIYTDSKIGADLIVARMQAAGYSARAWTGDLSRPERQSLKEAFIAGEFQYLVGTIQSMGTGIDGLQKVCNRVIWVSEVDGNPALNQQAEARYFRPGRVPDSEYDRFIQIRLVMPGTVDEGGMQALLEKSWRVRAAMNGGIAA